MKFLMVIVCSLLVLLSGCGTSLGNGNSLDNTETILTGYVIEVDGKILFNEKIKKDEFNTKSAQEILDEYYYTSIRLNTNEVDSAVVSKLAVGQKVKVTITGGIAESAPAQAKAVRIEVVAE